MNARRCYNTITRITVISREIKAKIFFVVPGGTRSNTLVTHSRSRTTAEGRIWAPKKIERASNKSKTLSCCCEL
jgi:hypothetical protein